MGRVILIAENEAIGSGIPTTGSLKSRARAAVAYIKLCMKNKREKQPVAHALNRDVCLQVGNRKMTVSLACNLSLLWRHYMGDI